MPLKNASTVLGRVRASYDGQRWSAWPKGDKPVPTIPSWLGAVGQWSAIASTLSASGVQQDFAGGQGVFAYSGGVVNSTGIYSGSTFISGPFLVVWGGGHNDYGGNELYCFGPLTSDSPQWYRPRDRTSPFPQNVDEDGSGNPVSRHTYGTIVYIGDGTRNWMLSTGGVARYTDIGSPSLTHVFDFNQVSPNTNQPWSKKANVSQGAADVAAYDSTTGIVWSRPDAQNSVQSYNVATNTYTSENFKSPPWSTSDAAHGAIDTVRGIWAIAYSGGIAFYRLNNGVSNEYYTPTTSGTAPTGRKSIVYDPVDDRFVLWNGNGKQLFFLTPPASSPYQGGNAWVWSSTTPGSGATPDAADTNGTKGRFGLVNTGDFRGYVLVNSNTSSVYFYRAA